MVLRAISSDDDETTPHRSSDMATAPVKSQPLHNFSLSFLKWGNKNQMNNHRFRRPVDSSTRDSPPTDHRSSASEPDSEGGSESETRKLPAGSRGSTRNRFALSSCSLEKSQKHPAVVERESAEVVDEVREKVLIRKDEFGVEVEAEESLQKPWNLRPRRASKPLIEIGGGSKNGELQDSFPAIPMVENLPKSLRLRGFAESQGTEKQEKKRKFWISLSRDEIEEDIFIMTGSKPARRPKKRPKNVQKQIDNVFPGLWLVGLTPDAYRVPDAPVKR